MNYALQRPISTNKFLRRSPRPPHRRHTQPHRQRRRHRNVHSLAPPHRSANGPRLSPQLHLPSQQSRWLTRRLDIQPFHPRPCLLSQLFTRRCHAQFPSRQHTVPQAALCRRLSPPLVAAIEGIRRFHLQRRLLPHSDRLPSHRLHLSPRLLLPHRPSCKASPPTKDRPTCPRAQQTRRAHQPHFGYSQTRLEITPSVPTGPATGVKHRLGLVDNLPIAIEFNLAVTISVAIPL